VLLQQSALLEDINRTNEPRKVGVRFSEDSAPSLTVKRLSGADSNEDRRNDGEAARDLATKLMDFGIVILIIFSCSL